MKCTVFRPKRWRNGKRITARLYRGRYRIDEDLKCTEVALKTSDKQVAQERLHNLIREKQQEAVGLIAPKASRMAAQLPLKDHLEEYCADLETRGRATEYVYIVKRRIKKLLKECQWMYARDITASTFESWRSSQHKAPKTLNEYLDSVSGLLRWMKQRGRSLSDPLEVVRKVETRGKEVRERRAYTYEEMRQLLAVSGRRSVVYLAAVHTGLRRGELESLKWADVFLEGKFHCLRVRATTTKNHRAATIPLPEELREKLQALKPINAQPEQPVFGGLIPSMFLFNRDLKAAGIARIDALGRRADFHALRHTLGTNLAITGAPPRVAMEVMRHSEMRLTNKTYTDASQLPTLEAIGRLPCYYAPEMKRATHTTAAKTAGNDSPIDSQNPFAGSPFPSLAVTACQPGENARSLVNIWESHDWTLSVTSGHEKEVVPRLGLEPRTN